MIYKLYLETYSALKLYNLLSKRIKYCLATYLVYQLSVEVKATNLISSIHTLNKLV